MKVVSLQVYEGINIYCHRPVIKTGIDMGKYSEIMSCDLGNGFIEMLLKTLPGLKRHSCGTGYENGFYERLREGITLAHIIEHLVIELQNILGYDIKFGKTRLRHDSVYDVIFEYINGP